MSKLREDIKLQISRSMPIIRDRDTDELLAVLLKEIESGEMCSFMNYSRKDNKYSGSREPDNFTGAALFSGSSQSGQRFTIKCIYCRKNHKNHECNLIIDPRSRKAILRAKSKCSVCLRGNHRMNECQSKLVCFRGKQRHHISICEQDDRNTQNNSNDLHEANENAENSAQNFSPSSVNFCNAENNVILLKTAEALISSKNNNREEKMYFI